MAEPRIWTELLTYGLGVALSPIHIVLLLLVPFPGVLIGCQGVLPLLQRGKLPCCAGENWWWAASVSGWGLIWAGRGSAA